MVAEETLTIRGYRNEPLPHTFFRQESGAKHLAILLPGMGYTADMPLLFYPLQLALEMKMDVLRVEYAYGQAWFALESDQRQAWLYTDAQAACQAALAQGEYQGIALIGKSLGTLSMGHLLQSENLPPEVWPIWLTPLLRFEGLRKQIRETGRPSLLVIGAADSHYDEGHLSEIEAATGSEILVVDGADHGLNIEGDVLKSIQALATIMARMSEFLST